MAKYIDVEPIIKGGWQLQRYNSGDGYVNQERASLKDIPPADVRPVVRGRWERTEGNSRFMCSVCKGKGYVPTIMGEPIVWDYCPHCGADMRGDAE